ncbi:MAG: hypothetical protein ACRCVA_03120, partial [Phreatobacter sp.]
MRFMKRRYILGLLVLGAAFAAYRAGYLDDAPERARAVLSSAMDLLGRSAPAERSSPAAGSSPAARVLTLSESQAGAVRVAAVGYRVFPIERQAVGSIDF